MAIKLLVIKPCNDKRRPQNQMEVCVILLKESTEALD